MNNLCMSQPLNLLIRLVLNSPTTTRKYQTPKYPCLVLYDAIYMYLTVLQKGVVLFIFI